MDVLIYKADVVLPGQTQATNEDVVIGIYDDGKTVFSSQLISLYKLFAHYNESVPLKLSIRGNSPVIISTGGKVVDVTKIYYQIAGIIDKNGPETVVNKFRPALYVQMTKMMGGEEASAKFLVDAVINDFPVNAPACQVSNHPVVGGAALGEQQGFGLRFFSCGHRNRRHCCRLSVQFLHGLQKRVAVDLDEIV